MRTLGLMIIVIIILACGPVFYGNDYVPPPPAFNQSDLVGTWQARYGTSSVDTITLKADGTYQQKFQSLTPNLDKPEPNRFFSLATN